MVEIISEFQVLLDGYIRREIGFNAFHDELLCRLQIISDKSTEEGIDLMLEIFACICEVEDGVMPEPAFRQAIQEFLAQQTPIPAAPAAVAD